MVYSPPEKKLDISANASIIDSMFKKIKDLFGIQALKESWKKLLKKSTDIGQGGRKASSNGRGGRGRRVKISMSTMNKSKKRSHKSYRGQGR